jgi:hypothetical protein
VPGLRPKTRKAAADLAEALARLPVLRQDALLYLLAGAFCAGVAGLAVTADYRGWAEIAAAPYLLAAGASELVLRRRLALAAKKEPEAPVSAEPTGVPSWFRRGVIVCLLCLVVFVPLGLQVTWRAEAPGPRTNSHQAMAQPEVAVIERAGDRFAHFRDPYLSHPTTVGVSPSNDYKSVNATSFFPYLPGMFVFGLANAAPIPRPLTDARVLLAAFSLLVVALALYLAPVSSRRKWRAFQFLLVLPTGALPIVTGGDDLPVLGLLLLGLVLVRRRQPVASGLAMGVAAVLKWTAWPLVLLALLAVRDEKDRPAVLRYGLSVLVIVVPVLAAAVGLNAHAFFENVVLFPLGLTKVHSPAASPLPGQALVQLLPGLKRPLTVGLVGGGAAVVLGFLWRHPPRTAYEAAHFAGWALLFATLIAPATRFGYLIYPANMLVWAYLLHEVSDTERRRPVLLDVVEQSGLSEAQLASSTW